MQKWKPNYVLLNNHLQVLILFFAKADTDTDTKGVLGNTIAFVSQIFFNYVALVYNQSW